MSAALLATPHLLTHAAPLPPLERLLSEGGDARLRLDAASGLNIYGCRPEPRPEAMTFSSSTASSISERAWHRAQEVRHRLAAGECADLLVEEARGELARVLGLAGTASGIVLAPSGTDAALSALAVARALCGRPLVGILAASDETGSGVPLAVCGRHFSPLTASGRAVRAGVPIAGLGEGNELVAVPLRDRAGEARDATEIDRDVFASVARAVAAGQDVLLVAMDYSKLGNRAPSDDGLAAIEATFGDAVRVVVDACQARFGLGRLRAHLERGRMVLVTGSKFFTGPPLSGALIVPPALAARLAPCMELPAGLRDYSIAGDWPREWPAARASLPARDNVGQLLRWTAALAEIEAWFAVPRLRRSEILRRFEAGVRRTIARFDALELLVAPVSDDEEFPAPTIFPFFPRQDGRRLSPELCRTLHRALNRDMRETLPGLSARERALATLPCHIGQPVAIAGTDRASAVLRVSAGARIVTDDEPDSEAALGRIFAKTELLLRNLGRIEGVV